MPARLLPIGKLPPDILKRLLSGQASPDPSVIIGPGLGLDCAVVDPDPELLVIKSDPVTFVSDMIGWYAVQVNANDIATTGARPRWFTATVLLPENKATVAMAEDILDQIGRACRELGIALVGGHTEVTHGLDKPIVAGTMFGQVARDRLISPRNVTAGDKVLLTKSIPIEGISILAREFPQRLGQDLTPQEIEQAAAYIVRPGISIVRDARIALAAGRVSAMHDPTEGGLASALWELATACDKTIIFAPRNVPMDGLAARICRVFALAPLATIASGALLLTVAKDDADKVRLALQNAGIPCAAIGEVAEGRPEVILAREESPADIPSGGPRLLPWPAQDDLAKIFTAKDS
jgi:hydrogenase maturation factor